MMRPLAGRVAVVTGGTSGIGRATTLALAAGGADVVVVGRDSSRLQDAVAEANLLLGRETCVGYELDVTRERNIAEMVSRTVDGFGHLDILVTAAGTLRGDDGWARQLVDMSVADWDDVLGCNLTGVYLCNRAVLPIMTRQRGGDIVNVSSTSGRRGLAYDSAYCASKFGVIAFSEAVAAEARPFGVRMHVVLPGAVATPMWAGRDAIPRPTGGMPPERVGELIRYLVSLPADTEVEMPVVVPVPPDGIRPGALRSSIGEVV